MTQASEKRRRPAPLSVKIFRGFAIFTLLILVLLWLFQTVFFDSIYSAVKRRDMKNCTDYLLGCVGNASLEQEVVNAANKYDCCINVYRISDGEIPDEPFAHAHIRANCFIHKADISSALSNIYEKTKESGYYFERTNLGFLKDGKIVAADRKGDAEMMPVVFAGLKTVGSNEYLVVADSEIVPISAATRVLTYQLMAVTAILLIASVIISLVISRRLSKPIKKMTEEASQLAKGNYDVNFENDGFLEAKELGGALNYAAGELSKLDSMQKELIANISHDLRTPLTMIRGYSEVMRDIPGEMNGENIQVIIDETSRLSSLVSDLLDLSKLTEEGSAINPELFSLTDAVGETLGRYSHLIEKDGYKITFDAAENVSVFADKTRILQVIYNLVNNAVNYTGEDKTVTVTQTVKGGKVRISVTDTGEGIPEDQLPLIWERYYKIGGFHNRGKVGTGLGLSIVKNVLVKHNAAFGVTSTPGNGSTFWFELDVKNN